MKAEFLAGDETHKNKLHSDQLQGLEGGIGNSAEFPSPKGALISAFAEPNAGCAYI